MNRIIRNSASHQVNKISKALRNLTCSIANQLRFGLVLLVVLSLLLTSGTLIYLSFQTQMQQVEVVQKERSHAAAVTINSYLDDLQRKLSYLARVPGLTDLSPEIQERLLEALTRHNSAYETVAILDNTGRVVTEFSPYRRDKTFNNLANSSLFLRPFKQEEDFVTPVEIDQKTKLPVVNLAVPIRNSQDKVNGVLIAQVNLKFLWFVLYQTNVGNTGYTYVIDNRNFLIAAKGTKPETAILQDFSQRPFIKNLTQSNIAQHLQPYRGLKGVEVIGASTPIRSVRWKVVVELPTAEAYAPAKEMLLVMGVALLLATLVAAGLGIFFSRQILFPLQRLKVAAIKISAGDLDTQVKVNQHNEFGVLATTFNEMTAQLRSSIKDLQKGRNFVSAILDTAGALVFVLDTQGRFVRFNRACEQVTGYSAKEVEGRHFWDLFIPPEEVEAVREVFPKIDANWFPNQYEKEWVIRDGSRRLISWSNTALVDADGSLHFIISTGIDITKRKQAEEELLKKEQLYRTMARNFPNGTVLLFDQNLRYIIAEGKGLAAVDLSKELMEGKTIWEALPVETCLQIEPNYRAALAGNTIVIEVFHRDRIYELHILPVKNEQGEIFAGMVMSQDITDRKRALETIERERRLFMGGPVTVIRWVAQENWPVEFVSANISQFGYEVDDFISGRASFASIMHPDDVPRIAAELQSFEAAGVNAFEQDYRIICPNGEVRWIYDFTVFVRNELGKITHHEGYMLDISDRKLAEVALRESETKYRSLFDNANDGIFIMQGDTFIDCNAKILEMYGCEREDIIGTTPVRTSPLRQPDGQDSQKKALQVLSAALKEPQLFEWQAMRWDGALFDVEVSLNRMELSGKTLIQAIVRDITDRKRAEQALRESEERFRLIVEGSEQVFFYVHDNNHRWQYLSPSVEAVLGYKPEDLIGQIYDELLIGSSYLQMANEITNQAIATGERHAAYVVPVRHKDGRLVFQEIVETPIEKNGQVVGIQGFSRDITYRVQAEEQLRISAQRDRLLNQIAQRIRQSLNLDQILYTTVTEIRKFLQVDRVYITYDNPTEQPGVVAESVDPQFPSIMGWQVIDETSLQELKALFESGRTRVIEDTSQIELTPFLTEFYAQYQIKAGLVVPMVLGNQILGVLAANHCSCPRQWQQFEIELLQQLATQVAIAIQQAHLYQQVVALSANLERQVEERTAQLRQKMEELQELYKVKDVFLHAFSHDLRTPIMGTLLVLKNLLNQAQGSGDGEGKIHNSQLPIPVSLSILERMIQSSERQLSLINSLLEAHSSEVGGIVLHTEPTQLSEFVLSVIEDIEPLITRNQASITNLITTKLPLVNVDSTQLRRVFENLITNALKYNPPGLGITLNATNEAGMIRCTIADNGVGMTQEQCASLFQLYVRGKRDRSSTSLGLGLYLCRQIINAHGGEIGANSNPGEGATFWFTLPIS